MTAPLVVPSGQGSIEASETLASVFEALGITPAVTLSRQREFGSPLEAKLASIALDPSTRVRFEDSLDSLWSLSGRRTRILRAANTSREVVVGAGFHAAVYAANRVLAGFPRPIVLERTATRVGGTFAMSRRPSFYLNSRNRPGGMGTAGDSRTSLNYLPGAPIQAASLSNAEWQTNSDMAYVIRCTLAQYAEVVTVAPVTNVDAGTLSATVTFEGNEDSAITVGRVIDARGLGIPDQRSGIPNGRNVLTFAQFMARTDEPWPLRGMRRVAVIGDGDSAKCAVETLLGLGPVGGVSVATLDHVERVDWYAPGLPDRCKAWRQEIRGRYAAIGRYLRKDDYGIRRLNVLNERATAPVSLADGTVILNEQPYDAVLLCAGNVGTFPLERNVNYYEDSVAGEVVAMKAYGLPVYQVGPCAGIRWSAREEADGVSNNDANRVSMWRLARKTALLAASLPALSTEELDGDVAEEDPF